MSDKEEKSLNIKIVKIKNLVAYLGFSKDPFIEGYLKGQMDIVLGEKEITIPIELVYGRYLYVDEESSHFDENILTSEIVEKINEFLEENSGIYYVKFPTEIPFVSEIIVDKSI